MRKRVLLTSPIWLAPWLVLVVLEAAAWLLYNAIALLVGSERYPWEEWLK